MDYEKKYKEALEWARQVINGKIGFVRNEVEEEIFPELKESEDERIRKECISIINAWAEACRAEGDYCEVAPICIAWLEKQGESDETKAILFLIDKGYPVDTNGTFPTYGELYDIIKEGLEEQSEIDKESYSIAEKEKYDFVSGQSLYCKGSFNEFKEGESYWLEYVGNDNYVGRSDNVLNQKFHITPGQLYTWLDPKRGYRHCENDIDENNAPTAYGKYVDECLNDASKHFFSEGEDKYSVADLFYAGVRCGKSWFEKQGTLAKLSEEEQNSFAKGVLSNCALSFINYLDAHSYEGKMCVSNGECEDIENAFHNAMWDRLHRYYCKYIEKQGEQKPVLDFKASNWYVSKVDGKIHDMTYNPADKVEPKFKVGDWVIKDCTVAQILDKHKYAFVGLDINGNEFVCNYGHISSMKHWTIQDAKDGDVLINTNVKYPFIFKETKPSNIKTDIPNPLTILGYCGIGGAGFTKGSGWGDTANCTYYPATKEQRDLLFQKMKEAGYEWDDEKKDLKKIEPQPAWSDEDDYNLQCMIAKVTSDIQKGNVGRNNELIDWLKSLKERMTWKPSKKQMETLEYYIFTLLATEHKEVLFGLYNDLKRL